ncbi:hypothetical protein BCR43DRAFT_325730 [Syncephalastrum racemosum]|uniref:Protein kinase domain-containing protein n=1 Tax=Syncephalastrum racemosum TaxID=13706 RepID=A0A1X2H7T1_SYNRA|nr:hypothetical protein BCR43DRAFT_325730 [Syncephalastrum racemosum]
MDKDSFHFSFERPLCFSPMMALPDTTTFIVPLSLSSSLWTVSGEIRIERDGSIALSRFDCLEFLLSAQGPPAVDMTATLPIEFVKILEPGIKDRLPDWSYIELSDTFSRGLVSVTRRQRIREPFWTSTVPNSSCERPYRIRIIVKASKNKGSKLYLSFQPDEDTTRPTFMHQKQARYIGDSRETFPQTIWEYKILKRISQGERGLVHRATFETSNGTTRDCIIKRIKKDPESAAELDILHTLRQQPHLNCTQMRSDSF